jgi:hypothetical protein
VLPSSKRPARSQDPTEIVSSNDYDALRAKAKRQVQAGSASSAAAGDDDERTQFFDGAAAPKSTRTPNVNLRGVVRGAGQPEPSMTDLRGMVRRPVDQEDRTVLRPGGAGLDIAALKAAQAARAAQAAAAKAARAKTPAPFYAAPFTSPATAAAVAAAPPAPESRRPSEPSGDPVPAVLTAKRPAIRSRSGWKWAAGLVVLGTAVGLAGAVVARGHADSAIEATASAVDPSSAAGLANGATAQAAVIPSFVETAKKPAPQGSDSNPAPGSCAAGSETTTTVSTPIVVNAPPPAKSATASIAGAEPTAAARPSPPKPAPVAYAAPRRWSAPAREQPAREQPSSGWLASASAGTPAAKKAAAAPKPTASGSGTSFDDAAAADALAKAQLEASLR